MDNAFKKLLAARKTTHGDFAEQAKVTQALKNALTQALIKRAMNNQPQLSPMQRESLDMIMLKVARIVAGDANFADHWDDIAGYALLCGSK
jgi:hypothetical protein